MAKEAVPEQPLASCTVTLYVPALRLTAESTVLTLGDQVYVYGEVPPVTVTCADPVLPPKQFTSFFTPADTENPDEEMTVADVVVVQPLESVIVIL